jgi:hypothetical protein
MKGIYALFKPVEAAIVLKHQEKICRLSLNVKIINKDEIADRELVLLC